MTSTTSGTSFTSGGPGTNPNGPTSSTIEYVTDRRWASVLRPATATSSPSSNQSSCAVGLYRISLTSTSSGWLMANATMFAKESAGTETLS
jgi:hypothetical protein